VVLEKGKKGFFVRLGDDEINAISLLASFRGETREQTVLAALKLLVKETFKEEIRSGFDFPLQKLPFEVKLSDVLRILGIEGVE